MNAFTLDDFSAFFRACHNHAPFDWQRDLAGLVVKQGWPAVLDLPTAAGKTAVIDIALFALAAQSALPPAQRTAPRRIALVVDRRVVVDGAHARACKIQTALRTASTGILERVRTALLAYGGETALHTAVLRGGIWRDEGWARTPLQPTILVGTVDQVGSRLLYRGYGLTPSARPIHAGLLANDTLIVLDEAHLSKPFEDTLGWIARYRTRAKTPLSIPFATVCMSATHGRGSDVFPADAQSVFGDTHLKRRLETPKPLTLVTAKDKKESAFVAACVAQVQKVARPGATVAVVVNRVLAARAIQSALDQMTHAAKTPLVADIVLLTGRCRPIERDRLLERHQARLLVGRKRTDEANLPALIVVATQCVEAGADFDFDALVTECCPLDSLRQRLGRLNRIGELPEAPVVVVARAEIAEGKADDPVYGSAAHATWLWLQADAEACGAAPDYSAAALRQRLPENQSPMLSPSPSGPSIFPAYCDLWVQTSPAPQPSPDPAIFLHGPQRGEPDVQLVWRADLVEGTDADWRKVVTLCPPVSAETLSVRLSVARSWLNQYPLASLDEADVEGAGDADHTERSIASPRPFLIWRGADTSITTADTSLIGPGDTLVVPAGYGGCDQFGWAPTGRDAVVDLAQVAYLAAGRQPVLRIFPGSGDVEAHVRDAVLAIPPQHEDAEEQVREVLRQHDLFATGASLLAYPVQYLSGWVLCPRQCWFDQADDLGGLGSVQQEHNVTLAEHQELVAKLARRYAVECGMPAALVEALALAGMAHDWGKADPRFQAILHGSRIKALQRRTLLAKSVALSEPAYQMARANSGYPEGARHELLSVRLLETLPSPPPEPDLVRHLVAAHHGRCRAFAPVVADTDPVRVTMAHEGHALTASSATGLDALSSGVAERFWNLTAQYGWWGLAFLEALLRLADHRASEYPDMEVPA